MMLTNKFTSDQINAFIVNPHHGLGLSGPDGAGKSHISEYLASKLLGVNETDILTNQYVKLLDASQNEGIDSVRDIQSFLSLKVPGDSKIRRVVIISHADMFGREAQNALLKILEEPPKDTVIILTASGKSSVLSTISSRLQWIDVRPITQDDAKKALKNQYEVTAVDKAWLISQGNAGLLVSLLRQDKQHPLVHSITEARQLLSMKPDERIDAIDKLTKDKDKNIQMLLDAMYKLIHASLMASINKSANKADLIRLEKRAEEVLKASSLLESRVQPKLVLTNLFYSL